MDFLESGVDINDTQQIDERLEKMRDMFKTSHLQGQLKDLEQVKSKMLQSSQEVFATLNK